MGVVWRMVCGVTVLAAMDGHWLLAVVAYLPMMCRTPNRVMGEPLALRKSFWVAGSFGVRCLR